MKKYLFIWLMLCSTLAHSDQLAKRINVEIVLVPMNTSCQMYYSLNAPGSICRNGEMYRRMYEVEFESRGRRYSQLIETYPPRIFQVSDSGTMYSHYVGPMETD